MRSERTVPIGQLDQSSPEFTSPRQDLVQAALGSLAIVGGGIIVLVGLALAGIVTTWLVVMWYVYFVVVAALGPIVALGWMSVKALLGRHRLAHERIAAETYRLRSELDINDDGKTNTAEMDTFLRYVRFCWLGGETTAKIAQDRFKIPGPIWQRYRDAMLALGLADATDKQGGVGFVFRPAVQTKAWNQIEARVRSASLVAAKFDITAVRNHHPGTFQTRTTSEKVNGSGEVAVYAREPITTLD